MNYKRLAEAAAHYARNALASEKYGLLPSDENLIVHYANKGRKITDLLHYKERTQGAALLEEAVYIDTVVHVFEIKKKE